MFDNGIFRKFPTEKKWFWYSEFVIWAWSVDQIDSSIGRVMFISVDSVCRSPPSRKVTRTKKSQSKNWQSFSCGNFIWEWTVPTGQKFKYVLRIQNSKVPHDKTFKSTCARCVFRMHAHSCVVFIQFNLDYCLLGSVHCTTYKYFMWRFRFPRRCAIF